VATAQTSAVQDLIDALGRLPGIGPKSAQRIAYHLLKADPEESRRLSSAIATARERVGFCTRCFNLSEGELCPICADERREAHVLCVVEEPRDVIAVERTREYRGRYHVLGGAIDHLQGVGPEQLRIRELLARIGDEGVTEVIICTNPNLEGEATALYLGKVLAMPGLTVSRIASGLPVGGDLEYADELTLGRALEGRRVVGQVPAEEPDAQPSS
jgi:recombination protein RecR